MIINMWSGPRNLSTALMRSFENRIDTEVWDEPLYAYYLKETKTNHPMSDEIINTYKTNINELITNMTKKNKYNKILYLKQMTHHLIDKTPIDWINVCKNCFLIRDPKKVILSYIKNNNLNNSNDIGYPSQFKIFKYLQKTKSKVIVINSDDLINDTKKTLILLCKSLNIKYTNEMLKWPTGSRSSDGIWGKVWYKKLIQSSSFQKEDKKNTINFPSKYSFIYEECLRIYEELNSYNLNK